MSFEWNKTINELYNKEDAKQILDDTVIIKYKIHLLGDDTFGCEILDKTVEWDNHDKYQYYDEEGVSCWEVLDMLGFIKDNFPQANTDDVVAFKVELKFTYHKDYYGDVDVQVEETLIHGMVEKGK